MCMCARVLCNARRVKIAGGWNFKEKCECLSFSSFPSVNMNGSFDKTLDIGSGGSDFESRHGDTNTLALVPS